MTPMPQHQQATLEELAHSFEDEKVEVDLSVYAFEDWVTLVVFWLMAACVFLQFFTRYVLNHSYAWTDEIALNGLIRSEERRAGTECGSSGSSRGSSLH